MTADSAKTKEQLIEELNRLRESNERYRESLDSASDWMWETDEKGVYTYSNQTVKTLLGYEPEEVIGRTPFDFMPPEEAKRVAVMFGAIKESLKPSYGMVNTNIQKDGRATVLETNCIPVFDTGGSLRGFKGIDRDITERKKAERALEERIKELQTLYDLSQLAAKEGITAAELHQQFTDMLPNSWQYPEIAFSRMVIGNSEFRTKNFAMTRWVQSAPIKVHGAVVGNIEVGYLEERPKEAEGPFLAEERALINEIALQIGLINERKKMEMIDERYRRLFNTMTLGVVYQAANGEIISANPAAEKILGMSFDQMRGKTSMDTAWKAVREDGSDLPGQDHPSMIALRTGNVVERFTMGVEHGERRDTRWIVVTAVPLFQPGEIAPFQVYTTLDDITESKQAKATLADMQKLESLGVMAGGIAHDFNNILTAILGNLSLLQSGMKDEGEGLELVKEAQDACGTAKGLSHQLLTFAKGGSPITKVMDLRPLLRQVADFAVRGANVNCVFDLGEAPLALNIDKEQISQVIQNLVINAMQATPQGGKIKVQAMTIAMDGNELPPLTVGRYVRVTVADQGIGIAPEILSKIFDPYFSTKGGGRGLGLSVCHTIMAKHGGLITADSRPGEGSVFTLHFPAADAADLAPEVEQAALKTGSGRVLIMDDDASVAKVLKRIIESLGYQAESVADGQAALDAYKTALEAGKPYDAVIMDLTIPGGMGGKEAMVKLKALDPKAKAIVSSGYSGDPVMSEYAAHGFCGAMSKPYSVQEVSDLLENVAFPKTPKIEPPNV